MITSLHQWACTGVLSSDCTIELMSGTSYCILAHNNCTPEFSFQILIFFFLPADDCTINFPLGQCLILPLWHYVVIILGWCHCAKQHPSTLLSGVLPWMQHTNCESTIDCHRLWTRVWQYNASFLQLQRDLKTVSKKPKRRGNMCKHMVNAPSTCVVY